MQYGLDALDLGLRALDGGVGLIALRSCSYDARLGPFVIAAALIESLLSDDLLADQFLSAFEIGFGRRQDGVALGDQRFGLGHRLLGTFHVGLRRSELGFVFRRRYAADDLSRFDFAAFFHRDIDQPARIFRRNIHLCGLDAAIGLDNSLRHRFAEQAVQEAADPGLRFRGGSEQTSNRGMNGGRRQRHATGNAGDHNQGADEKANMHRKYPSTVQVSDYSIPKLSAIQDRRATADLSADK